MSFKICIYADSETAYQHCLNKIPTKKKADVLFCHSQMNSRLNVILSNHDKWILFIDSDCEISEEILLKIETVSELESKNHVYCGQYINPKPSRYLQQVHNFIANTWIQANFYVNEPVFVGGAFLIFSDAQISAELQREWGRQQHNLFWGAEDKWLSQVLIKAGFRFKYAKWLLINHHTTSRWKHFFRRAFLQGYHDSKANLILKSDRFNLSKMNYWFLKLVSTNWLFHPAVGIHFFVLMMGKLIRQIHQLNNLKPS